MEQLYLKKISSSTLGGKNDVQVTFDDSFNCYVSKIDFFK